jgi:hypothetical protein
MVLADIALTTAAFDFKVFPFPLTTVPTLTNSDSLSDADDWNSNFEAVKLTITNDHPLGIPKDGCIKVRHT